MLNKIPGAFFILLGIVFTLMSINLGRPGIFPIIIGLALVITGITVFFSNNGTTR